MRGTQDKGFDAAMTAKASTQASAHKRGFFHRLKAKAASCILAAALAAAMLPMAAPAAYAATDVYSSADLAVINKIIADNGLGLTPADASGTNGLPVGWSSTVYWTAATAPDVKRVERLSMVNKGLHGTLDLRGLTELTYVSCGSNDLDGLIVDGLSSLATIACGSNQISDLDLSSCSSLTGLTCSENQLTELDVSASSALTGLRCEKNQLTNLVLGDQPSLTLLNCEYNQLASLDLRSMAALKYLFAGANDITSLNVSGLASLRYLYCEWNQISSLDLSGLTALEDLGVDHNQLTSLDLNGLPELTELTCEWNQLTSLDLSGLPKLGTLNCRNNQISELVFMEGNNLGSLMVDNNNLTRINLPDIIILLYSGTGQTASLALTGPNGSYSAAIDMREGTTFDSDKVSYGNGRLTSTDATLAAVAFTSPTGIDGKEISGTLSLSYTETAVPVLGGTVAVSGTAQVGNALTADTSGLAATPAAELGALTYQWLRNGAAIPGATGATYSLVDADSGAMISVTVAAANCDGSVTSAAIGPVAAKPAAPEPPKAQEPTIPQTGDNVLPFAMAGSLAAFAIGVFCLMLLRRRIRHTV